VPTRAEVEAVVEAVDPEDGVQVIDGPTMKTLAFRAPAKPDDSAKPRPGAVMVVLGEPNIWGPEGPPGATEATS
jgi:hypothetical protein